MAFSGLSNRKNREEKLSRTRTSSFFGTVRSLTTANESVDVRQCDLRNLRRILCWHCCSFLTGYRGPPAGFWCFQFGLQSAPLAPANGARLFPHQHWRWVLPLKGGLGAIPRRLRI